MTAVGVDTGGTFTDLVTVSDTGSLRIHKVPSTPAAPHEAILNGLHTLDPGGMTPVVHGTTVATNTVLETTGARIALVTTRGFRDILDIGRGDRTELYNLRARRTQPLVPRSKRFEAEERIGPGGTIDRRLTRKETVRVRNAVRQCRAEAVAVCLLHAYAEARHERMLGSALAPLGIPLSLSHDLVAEFREFERMSTTVLNAYVQPKMGRYIQALETAFQGRPLRIMQSGGGTMDAGRARAEPVRTLLSGPVGGVIGALRIAGNQGIENIITLDMGGTSTDVSLALGQPMHTRNGCVAGHPVQIPMVDIHTIGAGGGSIAEVDPGGALVVGPRSAGADPGPVAYGHGGTEVTVTDANVFLNRLPGGHPLAGGIHLDRRAVVEAMQRLARQAGMTPQKTATGILRVVVSRMARAVRTITLDRGHDPRDFTLVAFGGAAGLHAADLADVLGITRVLLPGHAGVLSAYGLIAAQAMQERSRTVLARGKDAAHRALAPLFAPLARAAADALRADGLKTRDISLVRLVDCRYRNQSFDITVPFGPGYQEAFHTAHQKAFGYSALSREVDAVTLRMRALGVEPLPPLPAAHSHLPPGGVLNGPRTLPFKTSTAFIPRTWQAVPDVHGGLLLTPARKGRD